MRSVTSALLAAVFAVGLGSVAQAKILTYCSEAAPEGFDPAPHLMGATFDASAQVFYDRLVSFVPGSTAVQPGLAESWDVSADGKVYTFHLRDGVKFHTTAYFTPTRTLNADDVVFSINRQRDKKNAWYNYAGGSWPYFSAMGLDTLVRAVEKVNATTVRVTLARPDPGILADLAMDFASILSKEYADSLTKAKTPEQLDQLPVGTGPFSYIVYNAGQGLYMVANRDYWAGIPPISNLNFAIVPGAADRLAKLQAGACQVMAAPDAVALAAAKSDANLKLVSGERTDVAFLAYNATDPKFSDPRVRKALGMAIDRQAIVDQVYGGAANASNSVMPNTMAGYDGKLLGDTYNVEGAKALLAEARVSNLSIKLLATRTPRPYSPDLAKTATLIAADLAKVGVTATVETPDLLGDYLRQSTDKKRDSAVLIGWTSDNGDPGDYLALLLSCEAVGQSNRTEWCDPNFTKALGAARAATDPATQATLYSEAQKIVLDQAPLTAIAHTLVSVPMRKTVTGVVADPLGRHNFAKADIGG
ncbi:MAG: ABC transporter substrate-binding protein [Bauldia sp.]